MIFPYDVDPDGDLRVIISEPNDSFAPAAGVDEPQFDANDHGEPPAPDNDNGAENSAPPAPVNDIGAENDEPLAPDNEHGAENHVSGTEGDKTQPMTHPGTSVLIVEDAEVDAHAQANGSHDTPPTVYSLRLSSKHLTLASPYVRKMYSGTWKDSTERDGDGLLLWRIDDLFYRDAFIIVMDVIHGRNSRVPRVVDLELLAKIAAITDYLHCHESMEILSVGWTHALRHSLPETLGREVTLWIMISSVFRTQEAFSNATRLAILKSEGELPTTGLPIHQNTIDKIEDRRQGLVLQLVGYLYDAVARLRRGLCSPECDAMLLGSLITQVNIVDLLRPRGELRTNGISVARVLQEIYGLSTPDWDLLRRKLKMGRVAAVGSPPAVAEPASLPSVLEHSRKRCTLRTLFLYVEHLEAGVTGLELEEVFGS